ncbi:unnamed protein product [Cuscuta campestris]|uniref:Replication protein A OB domain-containing protein n=1 Tax=Cuscuta campestris TaxID=132261 RepID=A0A484NNQ0_9ASTE|nr:unnamed protein product [Cuscuta campestris]
MAIVIQTREYVSVPGHAKTAHDFMLVNEEMKPVVLTLWEEFPMNQGRDITSLLESGRHPIILGKRVTVTPFNGRVLFIGWSLAVLSTKWKFQRLHRSTKWKFHHVLKAM